MSRLAAAPAPKEQLARLLYGALCYVVSPVIAGYLLWRSRRQPAYRRDWGQRFFGRYRECPASRCVWIHAVSVGETRAAATLIAALHARYPDITVLVTNMTPTGRETALALFGDRVLHAYLAYDYPHAVAAFFRHWRPALGIVMETEIWPNLMYAATRAGTPMLLANARLSPKSLSSASRWPALMRPALRRFARVLAQTDDDARRFTALAGSGPDPAQRASIVTTGNVKFDIDIPPSQREVAIRLRRWLGTENRDAPPHVFLFASTREGEEERIFDAWIRHGLSNAAMHPGRHEAMNAAPNDDANAHVKADASARKNAIGQAASSAGTRIVLAVVPRHPQRFDQVQAQARARGLVTQRRSEERDLGADVQVWLGDSMGELWAYYLAADLAYVGGSIVPLGGQNLIEAAAAGCPVLIGRNTFNFSAASDDAVRVGAAVRVDDYDALIATGLALVDDPATRRRMSDAGRSFAASHRGATDRSMAIVTEVLAAGGSESLRRPSSRA